MLNNQNNYAKLEIKYFNFLKKLSFKINKFYTKNSHLKNLVYNKKTIKFDPVTKLDKKFEELIRKEIKINFKKHNIIGEEFGNDKEKSEYNWIIDPIDGTKSLIAGNPTWSNLIGLDYKDKKIIGVANFPELNKFYLAKKNLGYVFF